jgi:hypothetical protein
MFKIEDVFMWDFWWSSLAIYLRVTTASRPDFVSYSSFFVYVIFINQQFSTCKFTEGGTYVRISVFR